MRRRLHRVVIGSGACLLVAACATRSDSMPAPPTPIAASTTQPCVPPVSPVERPDFCSLPADVRTFVEDRDACDHFRGEPWPEGDTDDDRARRRELVERVRTLCAGTDRRLFELLGRHRDDPAAMQVLSTFERDIESTP